MGKVQELLDLVEVREPPRRGQPGYEDPAAIGMPDENPDADRAYQEAKGWLHQMHQKLSDVSHMAMKYNAALEKGDIQDLGPAEAKVQSEIQAMLGNIGKII